MKDFVVTEITKEIVIGGTFDAPERFRPGTYAFAINDRFICEADASEMHLLSGIPSRALIVTGHNSDHDLDFVIGRLGSGVSLSIYDREKPENRATMKVYRVASVVKLLGTMVGEASPDQELEGSLQIAGSPATAICCYEPVVRGKNPYLQVDSTAPAVSLIYPALEAGKEVRIRLAEARI